MPEAGLEPARLAEDKGVDPAAQRKADAAEPTLTEVAGRFLQHQENRKRKSWKKMKGSMEAYIFLLSGSGL